jgi:hypothetical protein
VVTPANVSVARPLVEGLRVPTVAHDERIWQLAGKPRTTFDDAVAATLRERTAGGGA